MTALAQQWCGPDTDVIETFNHSWDESEGVLTCRWCKESMSADEAKEWMAKYGKVIEKHLQRRSEEGI